MPLCIICEKEVPIEELQRCYKKGKEKIIADSKMTNRLDIVSRIEASPDNIYVEIECRKLLINEAKAMANTEGILDWVMVVDSKMFMIVELLIN